MQTAAKIWATQSQTCLKSYKNEWRTANPYITIIIILLPALNWVGDREQALRLWIKKLRLRENEARLHWLHVCLPSLHRRASVSWLWRSHLSSSFSGYNFLLLLLLPLLLLLLLWLSRCCFFLCHRSLCRHFFYFHYYIVLLFPLFLDKISLETKSIIFLGW